DARGAIGVAERARYLGRLRRLTQQCAALYLERITERPEWALAAPGDGA
ncbi:glycine--tRNA ligase subunit alpha, partial [bacterium]|nr:glycine--tRNA ligase subunit alpha [bacterium]